ncbi:TPA: hypothetical protein ACNBB3_000930 [Legionella pneumophila]
MPPVTFLSEASQEYILSSYNEQKKGNDKIPTVPRNSKTGWPLLQLSMLSPSISINQTQKYEHVLGGGKCHYFLIGAFNFASLLAKVPGKMTVTGNNGKQLTREQIKADNVGLFLNEFEIRHHALGITISSGSGAYGKKLSVQSPAGSDELYKALFIKVPFEFAVKRGSGLSAIGNWKDSPGHTAKQIQEGINDDVAVFSEGQIFVDLGEFLDREIQNPELKEMLKTAFQVDEFLKLKIEHKEQEPLSPPPIISEIVEVISTSFDNLYRKIKIMRDYGETLVSETDKKTVAQLSSDLANKLDNIKIKISQGKLETDEIELFQAQFKTLLHSKDKLMITHEALWKPILANIALGIFTLGFGFLAIGIKAGIALVNAYQKDEKVSASDILFFTQSKAQSAIASMEKEVDLEELYKRP